MTAQLGVQLFSVRDDLGADVLGGTLKRLAAMGFTHVEPYDILGYTDALQAAMLDAGLVARTAHSNIVDPKLDRDAIVAAARQLEVDTIIVPWVEPDTITTRAGVAALATAINDAAAFAAPHGIRIGYHNHDFEFSTKIDGESAYDLLVSLLDDAVVLEVDTYWASVGGADVFELLPRLGERVRFLHVKTEPPNPPDRVMLGPDISDRQAEVLALLEVELPIVEAVVHEGDIFPVLERNAAFFRKAVAA
ncbi:MAG TPA: sugar phosphate isomerase/epimerase [Pseudonocardiaceae bacterium]